MIEFAEFEESFFLNVVLPRWPQYQGYITQNSAMVITLLQSVVCCNLLFHCLIINPLFFNMTWLQGNLAKVQPPAIVYALKYPLAKFACMSVIVHLHGWLRLLQPVYECTCECCNVERRLNEHYKFQLFAIEQGKWFMGVPSSPVTVKAASSSAGDVCFDCGIIIKQTFCLMLREEKQDHSDQGWVVCLSRNIFFLFQLVKLQSTGPKLKTIVL